jgi:hypothetical protein
MPEMAVARGGILMRYVAAIFLASLTGCAIFENETDRSFARVGGANTPATITTADVRMVMERRHPILGTKIICTEPSPDVAKALSAAISVSGQGGNGTITAGGAFGASTAEAVAELAGRSTALLGLRDGLYRACEAFANGAIGADAYALVLSRYGQLMTTLFLGQDVASVGGKGAVVQSPPVNVTVNASAKEGSSGSASAGAGGAASPSETTAAKPTDFGALALARMNEDYLNQDLNLAHLLATACINDADPTRLHGYALVSKVRNPVEPIPVTPASNGWLRQLCPRLVSAEAFENFKKAAIDLAEHKVTAPPVNPAQSTAQEKPKP